MSLPPHRRCRARFPMLITFVSGSPATSAMCRTTFLSCYMFPAFMISESALPDTQVRGRSSSAHPSDTSMSPQQKTRLETSVWTLVVIDSCFSRAIGSDLTPGGSTARTLPWSWVPMTHIGLFPIILESIALPLLNVPKPCLFLFHFSTTYWPF